MFQLKLAEYQSQCMRFMVEHAKSMVALDAGGGKTLISLLYLQYLFNRKTLGRALITAPNMVSRLQWPTEINIWKERNVIDLNVVSLNGPAKSRLFKLRHKPQICLINHEKLVWLSEFATKNPKLLSGFDTIIIDESSAFKGGYKCQKFKAIKSLAKSANRVIELTATPLPYNLEDLFNQTLLIGHSEYGQSASTFRDKYATKEGPWNVSYSDDFRDRYHKSVAPSVFRVSLEGKVQKPEIQYLDEQVELSSNRTWLTCHEAIQNWADAKTQSLKQALQDNQDLQYDEASGALKLSSLAKGDVDQSLLTPAGRYNLIRQLESGFVYFQKQAELTEKEKSEMTEEEIERVRKNNILKSEINAMLSQFRFVEDKDHPYFFIGSNKLKRIKSLVESVGARGEQILICFWFKAEFDLLKRMFPKSFAIVPNQKTKERLKIIQNWNTGKIPILMGNPASMGRGLNLQGTAENILFTTLPTSYDLYHQAVTRVWRQFAGADRITCYSLLSNLGFSSIVRQKLEEREENQNEFLLECEASTEQWILKKEQTGNVGD